MKKVVVNQKHTTQEQMQDNTSKQILKRKQSKAGVSQPQVASTSSRYLSPTADEIETETNTNPSNHLPAH